jgi:hypothetical protein
LRSPGAGATGSRLRNLFFHILPEEFPAFRSNGDEFEAGSDLEVCVNDAAAQMDLTLIRAYLEVKKYLRPQGIELGSTQNTSARAELDNMSGAARASCLRITDWNLRTHATACPLTGTLGHSTPPRLQKNLRRYFHGLVNSVFSLRRGSAARKIIHTFPKPEPNILTSR